MFNGEYEMLVKSIIVSVALGLVSLLATHDDTVKLDGVKCIVMGDNPAKADKSVDYKDGKVYMCCDKCVKSFTADNAKYSTKANHQLALTGQFTQKACPITGKKVADGKEVDVGGVKVGVCCDNCKGKVEKAEGLEAKSALVFVTAAFDKGFEKKADDKHVDLATVNCILMTSKKVNPEKFVEHNSGKVYFCCDGCVKKFSADPEKYSAKANTQLVVTGQYKQTGCPFSGGEIDESLSTEVAGAKVGFCCPGCKSKVEKAESDEARVNMIFGKEAFAKTFEKK
jgi:YHS domain-containing protein